MLNTSEKIPVSFESEMAVLGSVLVDPNCLYKILNSIEVNDFYSSKHQIIYQTILDIFNSGKKIDLLTLGQKLEDSGNLLSVGGRAYIASLVNTVGTSSGIKSYAEIIKDKSIRRQLLSAQLRNQVIINDEEKEIETVLSETQTNLMKITKLGETDDTTKTILREMEEVQKEYADKYQQGKKLLGFSCGFKEIDEVIDGVRPGHIWVVGAWTSTGKTQFALNIVHSLLEQNVSTSIISLEMSRIDTLSRLIGIRNNISSMAVLKGKNNQDIQDKITEAKLFFSQSPLEIHTTFFELDKIKMLIRQDVYTKKVKFIVIDYVQNIISSGQKEYDLMTKAATDLQALARELNITIYIVSQINNESEKGSGAGAGFKGTGALEAVADLAIRLKRDKSKEATQELAVSVDVVIAKNRHGFSGKIELYQMWLKSGKFDYKPV